MHHSTTRLCSSWLTVGLSPVVPTGTRPWVPSAICQLTRARKAASSSEPFLNGVTKAVNEPRKFVLAAMDFLRTHVCFAVVEGQFISGLAIWRKSQPILAAILPLSWRRHRRHRRIWCFVHIFNQIDLRLQQLNDSPRRNAVSPRIRAAALRSTALATSLALACL